MAGFVSRMALAVLPAVLLAAAGTLSAAPAPAQPGPATPAAGDFASMPVTALAGMLAREESRPAIDRYLRGDGAAPAVVARRAAALIRRLGAKRTTLKPEVLLGAVDQVAHVAARSLSFTSVMQLAVANDFHPVNAALAWDFGPPDGQVMPGFDRVPADDPRLAGIGVAALRRDDGNALLADGIAGLRRIELKVPDGDYRIILLTQNFGVPGLVDHPFGREVRVNGVPLIVQHDGPASWMHTALLTGGTVRAADAGYSRHGGYLVGNIADETSRLYPRQEGGALIVEGRSTNGRIVIELRNFGKAQSYLTGLIAERANEVSNLVLSQQALRAVVPQAVRIALESEILVAAAEVVQGIAPAAGQAIESSDVVTAN